MQEDGRIPCAVCGINDSEKFMVNQKVQLPLVLVFWPVKKLKKVTKKIILNFLFISSDGLNPDFEIINDLQRTSDNAYAYCIVVSMQLA